VVTSSVSSFLATTGGEYDLVFIDPPYDVDNSEVEHALEALAPRLAEYGEIVLERSTRTAAPALPAGLTLDKAKAYGETTIYWISAG
jgi:16S rRNA (guanine966-N2)-methyltransferase